jgi:hypothetical protein
MWALIVVGIFTATYTGQVTQVDSDNLQMMLEMSGDITVAQKGFSTEAACKQQLASLAGKHNISISGVNITVRSAECKEDQSQKGKGPKA